MNSSVSPFLVSANQTVDFTTVAAPDYMVDAGASILLAEVAGGSVTAPGETLCRELVNHPTLGDLTLVYRVIPAVQGDKQLTDGFGRPIRRTEGIVLRGRHPELAISESVLSEAHGLLDGHFRAFWAQTSKFVKPRPTSAMPVDAVGPPLPLTRSEPFDAAPPKLPSVATTVEEAFEKKKTPPKPGQSGKPSPVSGTSSAVERNWSNRLAEIAAKHPAFLGGAGMILTCLGAMIALNDVEKSDHKEARSNWTNRIAGTSVGLAGIGMVVAAIYHGGKRRG